MAIGPVCQHEDRRLRLRDERCPVGRWAATREAVDGEAAAASNSGGDKASRWMDDACKGGERARSLSRFWHSHSTLSGRYCAAAASLSLLDLFFIPQKRERFDTKSPREHRSCYFRAVQKVPLERDRNVQSHKQLTQCKAHEPSFPQCW